MSMYATVVRPVASDADGTKRKTSYVFGAWDWARGKVYLESVEDSWLPPGKRKWLSLCLYRRLGGRGAIHANEPALMDDVVYEAVETIRASIDFCRWEDRNK